MNCLSNYIYQAYPIFQNKTELKKREIQKHNETKKKRRENKPDRATMLPDCDSVCINYEYVTYLKRQMDAQTDETTK